MVKAHLTRVQTHIDMIKVHLIRVVDPELLGSEIIFRIRNLEFQIQNIKEINLFQSIAWGAVQSHNRNISELRT